MSDNPFDNEVPATPEPSDPFENFLNGVEAEPMFDPAQSVTLRSANGQSFQVPVTEPTPLRAVLTASGLAFQAQTEYWVNGSPVSPDILVAPGAVVTATTIVKGG